MESHEKVAAGAGIESNPPLNDSMEMQGNGGIPKRGLKDLDDLLPYIGDFGWYQRILFLLMIPYAFFFAFVYFGQIFMTVVPAEHWCFVEELKNMTVEARRHLSIPLAENNSHFNYDKCLVYDVDWAKILQNGVLNPDTKWPTKKCSNWEFNFTDVPYETIATQGGWVCDKDSYGATAQSIFFCGAILGGFVFGWVADKFGRIPALIGANLAGFSGGVGTAFTNSFWSFCLCRFVVGMAYDNCFIIMYIVVVEYVGPKWRTFVANMSIAAYFTFAACMLPWVALAVGDWRVYTLVISTPLVLAVLTPWVVPESASPKWRTFVASMAAFTFAACMLIWVALAVGDWRVYTLVISTPLVLVVLTPWVVPESARWLIAQGRIEEALKILKRCERINRKKIPDEVIKVFKETAIGIAKAEQECKNYSVLDLFKTPRIRRNSILLVAIWISISMAFDGHVRNSGALGLDLFLAFTVATATELPADIILILTLDVVGRRWLAFGSMVVSGVFSLMAATVPIGVPSASLAIVGRFCVNISFNIGMQYAAELLPTVVRAQGLAFIHITGYVATILVPYICYLATIANYIPLIILGILGILGGSLCLFLPESMGKAMPQTIEDGENYGRGQRFWDFPCLTRSSFLWQLPYSPGLAGGLASAEWDVDTRNDAAAHFTAVALSRLLLHPRARIIGQKTTYGY